MLHADVVAAMKFHGALCALLFHLISAMNDSILTDQINCSINPIAHNLHAIRRSRSFLARDHSRKSADTRPRGEKSLHFSVFTDSTPSAKMTSFPEKISTPAKV